MRFETAEIDRYGPLKGCRPPCDDGITVVAGPNESGKTLYLEGVLQLLDPGVAEYMSPGPRVDGAPAGRVVVDDGTERHVLGDGTCLSDVSRIEPRHLHNLFVVRDSDLVLPEGPDYYTTLVEHLGDIHTTEIEAIREELLDVGRLTPGRLQLKNRQYDTKDVRDDAVSLTEDIESHLASLDKRGIRETVRERLRVQKELSTVESGLETQTTAERVARFQEAGGRLEEYVAATETLEELESFDRETLNELREAEQNLEHARRDIEDTGSKLEKKREEMARQRDRLADAQDRYVELQQREGAVDAVEGALESYRDTPRGGEGFESGLAQRRYVTASGLVGAGIAAGVGAFAGSLAAILLGVVLLIIATGAWYSHRRLAGQVEDSETLERELLQQARDAGFEVETPEDVAPRVNEYETNVARAEKRVSELQFQLEQVSERIEVLESEIEDTREDKRRIEDRLTGILEEHDVDSIDEYEASIAVKEDHEGERSKAESKLEVTLGDPGTTDPEEKVAYWEAELDEMETDLGDTDVDADQYEKEKLERLEARQSELEGRLVDLQADFEEYTEALGKFDRRANELTPPPFVEVDPSLDARTDEGLEDLAEDLRNLVAAIDRNAEISRKAIGIFDDIRDDEEGKVATLFDPEGPASETFAHLTDGRYEAVDYDPEAETLQVTAADGGTLTPRQLSRGTRDQLYFAARLSLAEQLLDGGAGFLLLDDPFLAADRTRLRNGFETLQGLCEDGWQVVYLTAKPEVHDEMATEFGCPVHELELLEV